MEERNSIYPNHKLVLKTTTAWAATNTQAYMHLPLSNSGVYTVPHETLRACTVQELCEFYFLREVCPSKMLPSAYHALIGFRLSYGLACWGGTHVSTLYPVIIIQKSFIRIISQSHRSSTSWPLFLQLIVLPIRKVYIFEVLRLFYFRSSTYTGQEDNRYVLRRMLILVQRSMLTLCQ